MATYFPAGGGCMGNDPAYWRAERADSEGGVIFACGNSEEQAESLADDALAERERFLQKSHLEQLDEIAKKKNILSLDMERAIRLINQILQNR